MLCYSKAHLDYMVNDNTSLQQLLNQSGITSIAFIEASSFESITKKIKNKK